MLQLSYKPGVVALGKLPGFGRRTAAGDGQSRRTVRAQAQGITPRPAITDERDGNLPAIDREGLTIEWFSLSHLAGMIRLDRSQLPDLFAHGRSNVERFGRDPQTNTRKASAPFMRPRAGLRRLHSLLFR